MNFLKASYINVVVFTAAPKTYFKYLQYCVINNKTPNYEMLAKIMRMVQFVKVLKQERITNNRTENVREIPVVMVLNS